MRLGFVFGIVSGFAFANAAAAEPYMVQFFTQSIPVAIDCPGMAAPCLMSTDATLSATVTGNVANFTVTSPSLTETFTLPDYLAPTGVEPGGSPYFSGPNLTNATWDTAAYPIVTFWSNVDGGGISIGSASNDDSLLALFGSQQSYDEGSPSLFDLTGTPEPATWSMVIVGAALCGAMMRRRRSLAA